MQSFLIFKKNEMKQLFYSLVFLLTLSFSAQAQDYGSIEWDILRIGYVVPSGDDIGSGFALGSEARYNVNNNISAGIRWELALFGSGDDDNASVGAAGSIALIGDYYLQTNSSKVCNSFFFNIYF